MNSPPDPSNPPSTPKDFVSIFNHTNNQIIYCKRNPVTNHYEVITSTTDPSEKLFNLEPIRTKLCLNGMYVILYAKDVETQEIGKYVFEENEFKLAPECICQNCNLKDIENLPGTTFEPKNLMLLRVMWKGCNSHGVLDTFLDMKSGNIGQYGPSATGGLKLKAQNPLAKVLPSPARFLDPRNPLRFQSAMFCPHIGRKIYICHSENQQQLHIVFNKQTLQFESISCECVPPYPGISLVEQPSLRLIESFPSLEHGKLIGIFFGTDEDILEWREFTVGNEKGQWSKEKDGMVLDCRHMSYRDLIQRYNFTPIDHEFLVESFDTHDRIPRKLVFIEPNPFGKIYWMVDENMEMRPFSYGILNPGGRKQFRQINEMQLFEYRENAKNVLNPNWRNTRTTQQKMMDFYGHVCERCKGKGRVDSASYERIMKEYLRDELIKDMRELRSPSPPNFQAPPLPTFTRRAMEKMKQRRLQREEMARNARPSTVPVVTHPVFPPTAPQMNQMNMYGYPYFHYLNSDQPLTPCLNGPRPPTQPRMAYASIPVNQTPVHVAPPPRMAYRQPVQSMDSPYTRVNYVNPFIQPAGAQPKPRGPQASTFSCNPRAPATSTSSRPKPKEPVDIKTNLEEYKNDFVSSPQDTANWEDLLRMLHVALDAAAKKRDPREGEKSVQERSKELSLRNEEGYSISQETINLQNALERFKAARAQQDAKLSARQAQEDVQQDVEDDDDDEDSEESEESDDVEDSEDDEAADFPEVDLKTIMQSLQDRNNMDTA